MLTPPYRLLTYRGIRCLLCLVCNRLSWHSYDLMHHHCGRCHLYLDTLPEEVRGESVEGRAPGLLLGEED